MPWRPDYSSIWPGIGDGSKKGTDLIQDGTEQDVSTSGKTTYYFWIETFPKPQQEITNLKANVGDQVSVSASYGVVTAGGDEFVVCDDTQKKCVDGGEAAKAPDNHAEWIAERTEYCNSDGYLWLPALASFSIAQFSGGYYDLNAEQNPQWPISHGKPVITYMQVGSNRLATPGSLGSGGTAFNVDWNDYGTPINTGQKC